MIAPLRLSLSFADLLALTAGQCNALIPDARPVAPADLTDAAEAALAWLGEGFAAIDSPYFGDADGPAFDHLHGDHAAMWLYTLSRCVFTSGGDVAVAAKLFRVNRALHGCDIFYEVALPRRFLLVHPVGTVLGRAEYGDRFVAYQRCSVGSNEGRSPVFGQGVTLRPGSSVLGNSRIGDACEVGANALVLDQDVPGHHLFVGQGKAGRVIARTHRFPLWRDGDRNVT